MSTSSSKDPRIARFIEAIEQMQRGNFKLEFPTGPYDDIGRLGVALLGLAQRQSARSREEAHLLHLTQNANQGLLLDEILEKIYQDFQDVIPYNRIGVALITADGESLQSIWAKSDQPNIHLGVHFTAPLAGSSLEDILRTGSPRILNNLPEYLAEKPGSYTTKLIVAEGMKSSLTCPLIINAQPTGFIFFSSIKANTYGNAHIQVYQQIASQLSTIIEKGRLTSDLARKTREIERQNEELVKLNALKNKFVGMAAHDLRSPVAYIQMAVNLLRGPDAELYRPYQDDLLEQVTRQTQRLVNLLSDLLDISEIESGQMRLKPIPFDIAPFLDDTIATHNIMSAPKSIRVVLDGAPSGEIFADPERLRQVLDNLVSNAVKYSPRGSEVRVRLVDGPAAWRVEVTDQGPGISAQDRPRLFEAFAKLSAVPTAGEKATGLGLSIARLIVEAHGGQIGVESEPGQGATFWFSLPKQQPKATEGLA